MASARFGLALLALQLALCLGHSHSAYNCNPKAGNCTCAACCNEYLSKTECTTCNRQQCPLESGFYHITSAAPASDGGSGLCLSISGAVDTLDPAGITTKPCSARALHQQWQFMDASNNSLSFEKASGSNTTFLIKSRMNDHFLFAFSGTISLVSDPDYFGLVPGYAFWRFIHWASPDGEEGWQLQMVEQNMCLSVLECLGDPFPPTVKPDTTCASRRPPAYVGGCMVGDKRASWNVSAIYV